MSDSKIWLIKAEHNTFKPLNMIDQEKADKIHISESNMFTLKRVRNPKFHRKYFALINLAFQNQDQYINQNHFRKIVQMKAGYFEAVTTDKGIVYIPDSISYESMDETAFSDLYEKVWQVIYDTYRHDRIEFEKELNELA